MTRGELINLPMALAIHLVGMETFRLDNGGWFRLTGTEERKIMKEAKKEIMDTGRLR